MLNFLLPKEFPASLKQFFLTWSIAAVGFMVGLVTSTIILTNIKYQISRINAAKDNFGIICWIKLAHISNDTFISFILAEFVH